MKKNYLIFINTGGEQGNYQCSYMYYFICEGETEEEAVRQWRDKVDLSYKDEPTKDYSHLKCYNGAWTDWGRRIQIIELKDYEEGVWKSLRWE